MKSIEIKDSQKLSEVKQAFNDCFPHLKIEFYSEDHGMEQGSRDASKLDDSQLLKDVRSVHNEGVLSADGHLKTSSFESNFKEKFGVNVQVFRKSGKLWLQTTSTDSWTLAEQEKEAIEFER